jgi:hypothetical protein
MFTLREIFYNEKIRLRFARPHPVAGKTHTGNLNSASDQLNLLRRGLISAHFGSF